MFAAMTLVQNGIRWRIGGGEGVQIWKDNWLPRDHSLRPITPDLYDLGDITMVNLLTSHATTWDDNLVHTLFWEEDTNSILSIPLNGPTIRDIRAWHYTKHGCYSVKTAYYLACHMKRREQENRTGGSSHLMEANWDFVWRIKLPNKIKVFFWRLLKSALHVLVNLRSKHLISEAVCPVCACGTDTLLHIFTECHYARLFWAFSPLSNHVYVPAARDAWEWIKAIQSGVSRRDFEVFVCSCWSIWMNCNKIVHEGSGF